MRRDIRQRRVKALTIRQREIWDMRKSIAEGGRGMAIAAIAAALGISVSVVTKTSNVVRKKLGLTDGAEKKAEVRRIESLDPDGAAALIDALSDPLLKRVNERWSKIGQAYADAGLPPQAAAALHRRMMVKYAGATSELKALKADELIRMLGDKTHLALSYLDDKVLSEASARDIGMTVGILIEKRQLLKGEPTAIISDHERAKLHELLPLLVEEGRRRSIAIDGIAVRVANDA